MASKAKLALYSDDEYEIRPAKNTNEFREVYVVSSTGLLCHERRLIAFVPYVAGGDSCARCNGTAATMTWTRI